MSSWWILMISCTHRRWGGLISLILAASNSSCTYVDRMPSIHSWICICCKCRRRRSGSCAWPWCRLMAARRFWSCQGVTMQPWASPVPEVPRLPRETMVDVAKCHACHAKRWWMSPSATPATRNDGGWFQVPRLPRETMVDLAKCHACHAKRWWLSPSATPATRNDGGCRQVPRLPRETMVDLAKCHACHAKRWWLSPSATPATRNDGGCRQVPRLPRETTEDVAKCHACHAKRWWMSPSATPATRNDGGVAKCHAYHAKGRLVVPSTTPATQGGIESQKKEPRKKMCRKKIWQQDLKDGTSCSWFPVIPSLWKQLDDQGKKCRKWKQQPLKKQLLGKRESSCAHESAGTPLPWEQLAHVPDSSASWRAHTASSSPDGSPIEF